MLSGVDSANGRGSRVGGELVVGALPDGAGRVWIGDHHVVEVEPAANDKGGHIRQKVF